MSDLTKQSEEFYEQTDIKQRKEKGQYFTNNKIKKQCLKHVDLFDEMDILENSCGTGEFIDSILKLNHNVNIDAYDIDEVLVDIVSNTYPSVNSYCEDWLLNESYKKYDLIIGNPPYFELNKKQCKERGYEEFTRYSKSKANIYSFFIQKSITKLKPGGKLIYVVPTSMNNGYSFSPLRQFIVETCNIQHIELFSDNEFDSAQQNVMILVLERLNNDVNNSVNIFTRGDTTIFSNEYKKIEKMFEDKHSLEELSFEVKTGNLVWNQNKSHISRDSSDMLLLWACNIVSNKVSLDLPKLSIQPKDGEEIKTKHMKGQYIKYQIIKPQEEAVQTLKSDPLCGNCIIVNRVTGAGQNASVRAAIVNLGEKKYYIENHLNYIKETKSSKISLESVHRQLVSEHTAKIIKLITGNTQLSQKELLKMIPFELDTE